MPLMYTQLKKPREDGRNVIVDYRCDECDEGIMIPKSMQPDGTLNLQCSNRECRHRMLSKRSYPYLDRQ